MAKKTKPKYCRVIYPRQIKKLSRTVAGRKRLRKCGIRPRKK